jgi:hypothetical protein
VKLPSLVVRDVGGVSGAGSPLREVFVFGSHASVVASGLHVPAKVAGELAEAFRAAGWAVEEVADTALADAGVCLKPVEDLTGGADTRYRRQLFDGSDSDGGEAD